jgi:hypothetical protein
MRSTVVSRGGVMGMNAILPVKYPLQYDRGVGYLLLKR